MTSMLYLNTDCFSTIGKEKRVMPFNIRKKKPDVKVAYLLAGKNLLNGVDCGAMAPVDWYES